MSWYDIVTGNVEYDNLEEDAQKVIQNTIAALKKDDKVTPSVNSTAIKEVSPQDSKIQHLPPYTQFENLYLSYIKTSVEPDENTFQNIIDELLKDNDHTESISTNSKYSDIRSISEYKNINKKLIDALDLFHEDFPHYKKLNLTSGIRTLSYNRKIGAVKFSSHLIGNALDISTKGLDGNKLYDDLVSSAKKHNSLTVITTPYVDDGHIHVDIRTDVIGSIGGKEKPYNYFNDTRKSSTEAYGEPESETKKIEDQKKKEESKKDAVTESTDKNTTITDTDTSENHVISFIKLIASVNFSRQWRTLFANPGFSTLYNKIRTFIVNFFYDCYTVPNLPNCKCLVVKPETLFGAIPDCNVILPCMKNDISFSRDYRQEPTRIFLQTGADYWLNGSNDTAGPVKLNTVEAMESSTKVTHMPFLGDSKAENIPPKDLPIYKASSYEHIRDNTPKGYDRVGVVRVMQDKGGSELFTYMMANKNNESKASRDDDDDTSAKTFKGEAVEALPRLAKYLLLKGRYAARSGSITLYFNPYITPGFPMVSIEKKRHKNGEVAYYQDLYGDTFTVFGYVTNVVHNLQDRSWTTTVTYSYGHFDPEESPDIYPILENSYTEEEATGPNGSFMDMLGCDGSSKTSVINKFSDIANRDISIRTAYKRIKRGATTVNQLQKFLEKDFQLCTNKNFSYFTSPYFNTVIQEKILQYSKRIYEDKLAFTVDDTR